MERRAFLAAAGVTAATLPGCSQVSEPAEGGDTPTREPTLSYEIPPIDSRRLRRANTCDGEGRSPNFIVVETADPIASLAFVVRDATTTGRQVHWTLWNLPASVEGVPGGIAGGPRVTVEDAAVEGEEAPTFSQGLNYRGEVGYAPPCPEGEERTYDFRLYGLTEPLDAEPGAEPGAVLDALDAADPVSATAYTAAYGGEE
jgi:phosphatidylethanolamine-binding protein (PEBP) family uncharacterized protein